MLLSIIAFCDNLSGQFYDNHWMMGYFGGAHTPPTDSFGVSILSFYDAELKIKNNQEIDLFFDSSSSSLSGSDGDLLLYSNNLEIRNANDQLIVNGILEQNGSSEQRLPQTFVYLPFGSLDLVHYVHMTYTDGFPQLGQELSTLYINMTGTLSVYDRLNNFVPDSLAIGDLTACQHANGRDWWILSAVANKPIVYSSLLNPYGITVTDTMDVDYAMQSGVGQAIFSPNGAHYIRYNKVRLGEIDYLDIFDFNRETGKLSNHRQFNISTDADGGGVAVSPSSQYLYLSHYNHVFQYDLWADDIIATKDTVAIYDGYQENNFFNTRFFLAELAPDGKIYINCTSGVRTLHVIEYPDRKGIACDVRQHSISLPNFNSFTLANHPNYRLGPIDGSEADSLGLNNLPRAYFRTDRDTEDTLGFHFQDLSYYEPVDWLWTFGDGNISTERHPDHTYNSPGIYEVCLTVSNGLGTDTKCRVLELGPSSLSNPNQVEIKTFPNPVQDILVLDLGDYYPLNGLFKLFDAVGREVVSQQVLYSQAQFDLSNLPQGVYYYGFWDGGVQLGKGQVLRSN